MWIFLHYEVGQDKDHGVAAEDEVTAVHVLPIDGQAEPRDDLENPVKDDVEENDAEYEDAFEDWPVGHLACTYCVVELWVTEVFRVSRGQDCHWGRGFNAWIMV